MFEVLNTYVKNYELYLEYKAKVAANETPDGEPIELPDLRLGRCAPRPHLLAGGRGGWWACG